MSASSVRYVLLVGAIAAVYFAAAKFGLALATVGAQVSFVWPPAGIALAALLLGGLRLWPGVTIGATLVNASTGVSLATACGIGAGNTLEALVAVLLLRRLGFQPPLARLRDVFALVALAAGLSTIASATIGVTSLALGGTLPLHRVTTAWGTWWLGDALGDVVVAPIVLVGTAQPWRALSRRRGAEAAALLVAVVIASLAAFDGWFGATGTYFSLVYLVFPFALWATLRFGPPGAAVFTGVVSGIGIWGAVHRTGPFAHGAALTNNLLNTQVFMGVVAVMTLILAAAVSEREQAAAHVQALNRELEQRVLERTAQLMERRQVAEERALLLTREQAARQEAEAATARLQALQSITDTALAHLALADLLPEVLERITTALAVDNTAILLLDGEDLVAHRARGPEQHADGQLHVPLGQGIAGRIAAGRRPLIVDDLATMEVADPFLRESVHSLMGVPLLVKDRVIGVMHVGSASPRHFTADELRLLQLVADRVALAIDHAHLYEAEQHAHAQAEAAVQARDDFLSIAAHELKTPVTSLRGFAQMLLHFMKGESRIDAPKVRLALQHIDEQSDKLHALVVQLLDLSRIEAGRLSLEKEVVDVATLVEGVVTAAQARASGHALVVDAPGPVRACIDPLRVEQVLVNLVNNAIKYSPAGGSIDLTVRQSEATVQVAVRDHGLGIPPEHREHIFDRFYQAHAHSHRSGMGLGLHISRQIVELHGGSIAAEFPMDGGARFVVALPAGHDDTRGPV